MSTYVTETPAAPAAPAARHFDEMLTFETDCWDVHESLKSAHQDFLVIDVRSPDAFARGHVEGAVSIPYREITAIRMAEHPGEVMIGGITGWLDGRFALTAV
jgi:hypothetical protein